MPLGDDILAVARGAPQGVPTSPDQYLLQAYVRMDSALQKQESKIFSEEGKREIDRLEAQVSYDRATKEFIGALSRVKGDITREEIKQLTSSANNIRDNYTRLAATNNAYMNAVVGRAAQVAASGTPADGYAAAFNTMLTEGMVNEFNAQLPQVLDALEDKLGVPIESLDPDTELGKQARDIKAQAEAARRQIADARINNGETLRDDLQGIIDHLATGDVENLDALLTQAHESTGQLNQQIAGMTGRDGEESRVARDRAAQELGIVSARRERVEELRELALGGKATKEDKIAKTVASPKFQEWAKSNGFDVGTAEIDESGRSTKYVPGKDDIRAIREASRQGRRDVENRTEMKSTGRLIRVETKGQDPTEFNLAGAGETPSFAWRAGVDGTRTYLRAEDIRASEPTVTLGSDVDGNWWLKTEGTVYAATVDADTGVVTVTDHEVNAEKQIPRDADGQMPEFHALVKDGDFMNGVAPGDTIDMSDGSGIEVVDHEGVQQIKNEASKRKLEGVEFTAEPPSAQQVRFGEELMMDARDPQGSLRFVDSGGVHLVNKENIATAAYVGERSKIGLDTKSKLRGRHSEQLARQAALDAPDVPIKNLNKGPTVVQDFRPPGAASDNTRRGIITRAAEGVDSVVSKLRPDNPERAPVDPEPGTSAERERLHATAAQGSSAGEPEVDDVLLKQQERTLLINRLRESQRAQAAQQLQKKGDELAISAVTGRPATAPTKPNDPDPDDALTPIQKKIDAANQARGFQTDKTPADVGDVAETQQARLPKLKPNGTKSKKADAKKAKSKKTAKPDVVEPRISHTSASKPETNSMAPQGEPAKNLATDDRVAAIRNFQARREALNAASATR